MNLYRYVVKNKKLKIDNMSFSAQICLTNTGTTQLGPTLYFYSDITSYQGSFGSDSTDNLVGDNCPYTMENIPDGTSIVRIIDPSTNCCNDITLQSNDLCNTYNLNFDVYETQTVSQIVAGNLIGDTVSDISDYIINWYGPGEGSTELAFTSGYGTEFSNIGWDLTHPLTGSSSPIIESGVYTPVIDRVIVDGTTFSLTGAPDTYIANLDCFTSALVTVDAIKCDNGNLPPGGIYSHFFQFNNVSVGNPPLGLSASFELSSSTNYIAWQFKGYQKYDNFKMTFYGSEYDFTPLVIENVRIGLDAGDIDVLPQTNPKRLPYNDFVRKVTCLTAFTINEGDYITINITPNNVTNNTIWDFYLKCLNSFDCSTCFDQFQNSSAKIISANTLATLLTCNRSEILIPISACTEQDFNQTDTGKYLRTPTQNQLNSLLYLEGDNTGWFFYSSVTCNVLTSLQVQPICSDPTNSSYTFQKTIEPNTNEGFISFTFNSVNDLIHYYNSYQTAMSNINSNGGASYDNTQINYYRTFQLRVPNNSNPDLDCGDTTPTITYDIHHTSVVTTGGTGPYTMTLTMPTIIDNMNFTECQLNCNGFLNNTFVNNVNNSSLSQSNNIYITTNTGSKYVTPFAFVKILYSNNTQDIINYKYEALFTYWSFENDTYVYSGNNTLVSSLTGRTCQPKGMPQNLGNPTFGTRYILLSHDYKIQLTDPNNLTSFQVLASNVSNYILSYDYTNTAMTVVNNVVTYANPNYCI
jgi:hypothetical protein